MKIKINEKYLPLYNTDNDLIIITGGRGSGKSFTISDWACRCTYQKDENILYTRYTLTSAKDSIIPEYKDKIELFDADNDFKVTEHEIINVKTNSRIIFKGIKNSSGNQTANLKSIKDPTKWICDEAAEIPDYNTFQKIKRSLRKKGAKIQTILVLNPERPNHWIYQTFFNDVPEYFNGEKNGITYIHTTYLDNLDNLDETFIKDAEKTKLSNYLEYENIFLGKWTDYLSELLFEKSKLKYYSLPDMQFNENDLFISYTDTANGGDYFCTVFGILKDKVVYIQDVIYNKELITFNQNLLPIFIKKYNIQLNIIESNAQGYLFAHNVKSQVEAKHQIKLKNNSTNKEDRIKMNAILVNDYFCFRKDITDNGDYINFMRDLTGYIYNEKNLHDDAPDACTALSKELYYMKLI